MIRIFLCFIFSSFLFACKSGKKSLNSEESISVEEFVESFPELKLPFAMQDSLLDDKLGDTALISTKLLQVFIPDSLYNKDFKNAKPKFYALGRAVDKNEDQYLVIKAATATKQVAYIACFNKEDVFKAGMPFVANSSNRNEELEGLLDKKFTISSNRKKKARDGQIYYSRNVYVYNSVGTFTLILMESNEVPEDQEVFNPIDSAAASFKWTGNYVKDKKNFISVRDGSKPHRLSFFIHFEKNNGECVGELKGEADMVQPSIARYSAAGDPCSLEFRFENNKVSVTELNGCGNHRGIKCFFNDSYPKKLVKTMEKKQARIK
jgi:hypothetical protein